MDLYDVAKIINPLPPRTAKPGVNVQELVRKTFPEEYNVWLLFYFDWGNDLQGVLDYLYGKRALSKVDTSKVIKLIEDNSEEH